MMMFCAAALLLCDKVSIHADYVTKGDDLPADDVDPRLHSVLDESLQGALANPTRTTDSLKLALTYHYTYHTRGAGSSITEDSNQAGAGILEFHIGSANNVERNHDYGSKDKNIDGAAQKTEGRLKGTQKKREC